MTKLIQETPLITRLKAAALDTSVLVIVGICGLGLVTGCQPQNTNLPKRPLIRAYSDVPQLTPSTVAAPRCFMGALRVVKVVKRHFQSKHSVALNPEAVQDDVCYRDNGRLMHQVVVQPDDDSPRILQVDDQTGAVTGDRPGVRKCQLAAASQIARNAQVLKQAAKGRQRSKALDWRWITKKIPIEIYTNVEYPLKKKGKEIDVTFLPTPLRHDVAYKNGQWGVAMSQRQEAARALRFVGEVFTILASHLRKGKQVLQDHKTLKVTRVQIEILAACKAGSVSFRNAWLIPGKPGVLRTVLCVPFDRSTLAHEVAHWVFGYWVNQLHGNQQKPLHVAAPAGMIEEGLSDILGVLSNCVYGRCDYLMYLGKDAVVRDLRDPRRVGKQPGHVDDLYRGKTTHALLASPKDGGSKHLLAGILGRLLYETLRYMRLRGAAYGQDHRLSHKTLRRSSVPLQLLFRGLLATAGRDFGGKATLCCLVRALKRVFHRRSKILTPSALDAAACRVGLPVSLRSFVYKGQTIRCRRGKNRPKKRLAMGYAAVSKALVKSLRTQPASYQMGSRSAGGGRPTFGRSCGQQCKKCPRCTKAKPCAKPCPTSAGKKKGKQEKAKPKKPEKPRKPTAAKPPKPKKPEKSHKPTAANSTKPKKPKPMKPALPATQVTYLPGQTTCPAGRGPLCVGFHLRLGAFVRKLMSYKVNGRGYVICMGYSSQTTAHTPRARHNAVSMARGYNVCRRLALMTYTASPSLGRPLPPVRFLAIGWGSTAAPGAAARVTQVRLLSRSQLSRVLRAAKCKPWKPGAAINRTAACLYRPAP